MPFEIRTNGVRPENRRQAPYRVCVIQADTPEEAVERFDTLYRRSPEERILYTKNVGKGT